MRFRGGWGAARRALCRVMELRIVACLAGLSDDYRFNTQTPSGMSRTCTWRVSCLHALVFYVPLWFPPRMDGGGSFLSE